MRQGCLMEKDTIYSECSRHAIFYSHAIMVRTHHLPMSLSTRFHCLSSRHFHQPCVARRHSAPQRSCSTFHLRLTTKELGRAHASMRMADGTSAIADGGLLQKKLRRHGCTWEQKRDASVLRNLTWTPRKRLAQMIMGDNTIRWTNSDLDYTPTFRRTSSTERWIGFRLYLRTRCPMFSEATPKPRQDAAEYPAQCQHHLPTPELPFVHC
jgi:hypothetical protein